MKIIVDKIPEFPDQCDFCRTNAPGFSGAICSITMQDIVINGKPEISFALCGLCNGGRCTKLKTIKDAMVEVMFNG